MNLARLLALIGAAPVLILAASVVAGIITLGNQARQRTQLLDRIEPAEYAALRLTSALLNQETGIRGDELTGRREFLEPYELGRSQQRAEVSYLRRDPLPGVAGPLNLAISEINVWQRRTAIPAIRSLVERKAGRVISVDATLAGKRQFDAIRRALGTLQAAIELRVRAGRRTLADSARATRLTLAAIAVVLLISVLGAVVALQRLVRRPIERLAAATRQVADGDLARSVVIQAPLDIEQLAADVEAMRQSLLRELEAANDARTRLAATAADLQRSNAELEQFAYVASHDLQEPLRKVTSFCQLLAERYGGELDERADQYIEFAVDGARRMQQLITDLLAFSRVGQMPQPLAPVDLGALAGAAWDDLQQAVTDAGAEVTIGTLPVLPVETSLMRAVFQNLMANAIKFRTDAPPKIELVAQRQGEDWLISCTDNGIGIDPEYAERIFAIFQRLHPRDSYPGTGIGLAMCRKIVEYHGGRIWVDISNAPGARILFTLPAADKHDRTPAGGDTVSG